MKTSTMRILLAIFSIVIIVGTISFVAGLVTFDNDKVDEVFGSKVNPDNLYTVDALTLYDQNQGKGIIVDVDEKTGAISLSGTATEDIELEVGTVTLKAGKYTLTAYDRASYAHCYVTASTDTTVYNFDFTPGNVIEVPDEDITITIKIHIVSGAEFDNTQILPVIVSGSESGSFYK